MLSQSERTSQKLRTKVVHNYANTQSNQKTDEGSLQAPVAELLLNAANVGTFESSLKVN